MPTMIEAAQKKLREAQFFLRKVDGESENIRNEPEHPAYGLTWFGPPDIPLPEVGRLIHHFKIGDRKAEVVGACKRCVDLLDRLVFDFNQKYS